MWDPAQYRRFSDERSRPFFDLVGRIGAPHPAFVVDLGCGTGELTATLLDRWPDALVVGVDSSAEMVADSGRRVVPGRLHFHLTDLREWRPNRAVDVILSNAALHWVPEHPDLLPRWVQWLAPSGWLAFQVPGNDAAPSHELLGELRRSPRWRDRLDEPAGGPRVLEPADYLERLVRLGCEVDAWETTYLHVLAGQDAVLEWVKGTALRPVLAQLGGEERDEFLGDYGERLREAYPSTELG